MDVEFSPLYSAAGRLLPHPQPRESNGRVRKSYTLQYKLEVVQWVEEHESSLRQASKQFGITRRVLRTWCEQRNQLREALDSSDPNKRKLHSGRPPASEELDRRVLDFLVKQSESDSPVSDHELRSKALELSCQVGLTSFKANQSWLRRWKQRCGVDDCNKVVRSKVVKASKSAYLSRIDPSDKIKLTIQHSSTEALDMAQVTQGPVYLDFTTCEHNYCQKPHQPDLFSGSRFARASVDAGKEVEGGGDMYGSHDLHCHHLGCEQDISILSQSSEVDNPQLTEALSVQDTAPSTNMATIATPPPVVRGGLDLVIPVSDVVDNVVESLELPLGHEEIVGDSSGGRDSELIITQAAVSSISPSFHRDTSLLTDSSLSSQPYFTSSSSPTSSAQQTLLSANYPRETAKLQEFVSLQTAQDYLISMNSFLQEASGTGEVPEAASTSSTSSKSKGGRRRSQSKRGGSRNRLSKTKAKKSTGQRRGRAVTPVATFPNLMLDDPQGYSGLLASRLSQPVFPGEPEFVYTDMATSH